jgi:hypothetical protein
MLKDALGARSLDCTDAGVGSFAAPNASLTLVALGILLTRRVPAAARWRALESSAGIMQMKRRWSSHKIVVRKPELHSHFLSPTPRFWQYSQIANEA